jgi:uncharacterized membrane protein YvbJ
MVWACPNCGTNNKETAAECIVCGTAKPARKKQETPRFTPSEEPVEFVKKKKSGLELQIEQAQEKYGGLFKK